MVIMTVVMAVMIMSVVAVVRMAMFGDRAVAMLNAAVRQVGMIVLVVVDG